MEKVALCKECGLTKPDLLVIIPKTAENTDNVEFMCESCYLKSKDADLAMLRQILTIINDIKLDLRSLKMLENAHIADIKNKADFKELLAESYGGYRAMWHDIFAKIMILGDCVNKIDISKYPRVFMCEFTLRQWEDYLHNLAEVRDDEIPILMSEYFYLLKYALEFAKDEILKALGDDIKVGGVK